MTAAVTAGDDDCVAAAVSASVGFGATVGEGAAVGEIAAGMRGVGVRGGYPPRCAEYKTYATAKSSNATRRRSTIFFMACPIKSRKPQAAFATS